MNEAFYNIRGTATNVAGLDFPLVSDYKVGKDGQGYVTVDGSFQPGFPERSIRIRCEQTDFTTGGNENVKVASKKREETDEEIIERLRSRFEVLHDMTAAVKEGNVRAMIVTGPPGVGKSFGVEEVLNRNDIFDQMANRRPQVRSCQGCYVSDRLVH